MIGAALASGALVIGRTPAAASLTAPKPEIGAFGPYLRIEPDGWVTVVSRYVESGQGNHAGLASLVAEELDADWTRVRVVQAPADVTLYKNPGMGVQGTGGSGSIAGSWMQLRQTGAAARAMFVEAAAKRWSAPAGEITVRDGVVAHAASKRSAAFAELLAEASKVTPPQSPALKDPKAFTLVGTDRVRRKDVQSKTDGTARFTQDVRLPGMLTAVVARAPRFGATVKSFDATAARKVPGVVAVHQIPSGVAVVAKGTWAARQGRDALEVVWDESKAETRGSDVLLAQYRDWAAGKAPPDAKSSWVPFVTRGDAGAPGGELFEATYDFPYLAHAPMEPLNCVAQVDGDRAKLMFGSQIQTFDQINTARVINSKPDLVEIETLLAGGSFGRRSNAKSDYVVECVEIARRLPRGTPLKLVWTREDDITGGYYRPLTHHAVRITLGPDGFPATWRHRLVTQPVLKGTPWQTSAVDRAAVEGIHDSPYIKATPAVDAQVLNPDVGVPVLWWRSVGATHTAFVMEHTIDQLARRAGKDPVEYRRAIYRRTGAARRLAALELAVAKSGWGSPAPAGWSRGIAVHEAFGSVVAQVAEVKLENGAPKVGRVVTAVDCGLAVSPDQVAAQMEGGTCYGLSAALFGQVTLKDGRVEQTNFDGYRVLRFSEAPQVETHVVPSGGKPTGVGEPGTPVIAPAVANALLALNGKPTYALPFVQSS